MSEQERTATRPERQQDGPAQVDHLGLRADCTSCFGLCCVALPFAASADFAVDKAAGRPCGNLGADVRCDIHARLRQRGFSGCVVFDCFGAGQKVVQHTFAGRDWRRDPERAEAMFTVFPVMLRLHEMLAYLAEALARQETEPVHADLCRALEDVERVSRRDAAELAELDLAAVHQDVDPLLRRAAALVRAKAPVRGRNHRRADLVAARLRGADLRGADLRGALLIAADLRGADLRWADLIGADLRNADLRGADLTESVFLVQAQLAAAEGDDTTRLPPGLARPAHWHRAEHSRRS